MDTLATVTAIAREIEKLINEGKTLQQISKITYDRRESGENMIYCGWLCKGEKNPLDNCLEARPVANQKEIKAFFSEVAEGTKIIPKYVFRVYPDRVEFVERSKATGKCVTNDLLN